MVGFYFWLKHVLATNLDTRNPSQVLTDIKVDLLVAKLTYCFFPVFLIAHYRDTIFSYLKLHANNTPHVTTFLWNTFQFYGCVRNSKEQWSRKNSGGNRG